MEDKLVCGLLLVLGGVGCVLRFNSPPPQCRLAEKICLWWQENRLRIRQLVLEKSKFVARREAQKKKQRGRKLDQEIFTGILVLKNLAIAQQDHAFSADYIYERLMENSHRLRPVYAEMLSLYRSGRDAEAFSFFSEHVGTQSARNFSMILAKLGQINPHELVEQMDVFQEMTTQKKMTADLKRAQKNSLLVTSLATATVFAGVIDFAVVVVFMHALGMMKTLF